MPAHVQKHVPSIVKHVPSTVKHVLSKEHACRDKLIAGAFLSSEGKRGNECSETCAPYNVLGKHDPTQQVIAIFTVLMHVFTFHTKQEKQ